VLFAAKTSKRMSPPLEQMPRTSRLALDGKTRIRMKVKSLERIVSYTLEIHMCNCAAASRRTATFATSCTELDLFLALEARNWAYVCFWKSKYPRRHCETTHRSESRGFCKKERFYLAHGLTFCFISQLSPAPLPYRLHLCHDAFSLAAEPTPVDDPAG